MFQLLPQLWHGTMALNCEGSDGNGLCLLLVPLSICSFFSIKHSILEIDNDVYSRKPGNHCKKGFG